MNGYIKQLLLLCGILINFISNAQEYEVRFTHISVKDGLSQSTVYTICQDSKGFMWFGTQNSGLNRYDGYDFKIYRHKTDDSLSISSDDISNILEDKDGTLWIGTWGGGLENYNPVTETFTHYIHDPNNPTSLSNNRAQTLLIDKNNNLWIGTAGGGLCKYIRETDNFISYMHNPYDPFSISNNRIWTIAEDTSGILWIGTDYGLNKFDPETGKFKRYLPDVKDLKSLSHIEVRNVYIDHYNTLWIGTSLCLNEYHPETDNFSHYHPFPDAITKLYPREINRILEDHNNVLWVGTQMGGLCIFDRETKTWTKHTHDPKNTSSLSYNDIRDIFEDRSRNIWISTRGGGLNKMDLKPQKFKLYKKDPYNPNSLSGNRISAIIEDEDDYLWLGTDGAGLNRFNRYTGDYIHFKNDPNNPYSINRGSIQTLYEDYKGNIWIGFDINGADILNKNTLKAKHITADKTLESYLSNKRVNSIVGDKKAYIWLGTKYGLCKYDNNTGNIKHYFHDPLDSTTIVNNNISILLYDLFGKLWIGTEYGLSKFDPVTEKSVNYVNNPDDLSTISSDNINNLYEDINGNILIGTTKGLNIFNRKTQTFTYYTIKDGLATDDVYGILDDNNGHIWFSSFKGISVFDPASGYIRNFDIYDGLQNNMFSKKATLKSKTGEFFFGGIDGFNSFFPENVKHNPHAPKLVFTDFQIFNEPVKPGKDSPLKRSITYTDEIILSYKQSVFSIWFSALEYTIPEKNQYAFKLEGFEENWNYMGNRRFAHYTNLDPDTYIFKVKASNNDKIWNTEGISLKITITPPFWKTTWFISLEIIIIIFGIALFIKIRERNLRQYSKVLEEKVKLRTFEIEQQKEEILAQSEELKKLSIVASETDNAVIIADKNGNIEWVNDGFTRLLEYTFEEFLSEQGNNLFETSTHKDIANVQKKCIEHKVSVTYSSENKSKSGRDLWLQTTLTPILDDDDNIYKYVAIDSDITKIKRAEEEIIARNNHIAEQRDQILKQNNEIVASILYASRIQKASLPPDDFLDEIFSQYFIFNKPKDIVSGDFYWAAKIKDDIILAVADCTGHGVPGALMSMISVSFLNKIVNEKRILEPNLILDRLKINTINALHQTGGEFESNDGMDVAIIKYNVKTLKSKFAGAMNPIMYIRNGELNEVKGDRMSVGFHEDKDRKFQMQELQMQKNDMFYLFSDGYSDQFGGKDAMRFLKKNFKNLLTEIHQLSMQEQKEKLESAFLSWKGYNKQIDDILVLGVRI